jgi:hypothetical protein
MRLLLTLFFILGATQVHALREEPELNFILQTSQLMEGEIQYSFKVLSPEGLKKLSPLLSELDSLGLVSSGTSLMVSKFAFVVKKPMGIFDQKEDEEADFLSFLSGGSKVKRMGDGLFSFHTKGEPGLSYQLARFEDSDDISTLSRSKAARGIQAVKRLDPLFQSASLMIFQELTNFSHSFNGATELYAYLPLNEFRTLVFGFKLVSLKDYSNDSSLKQSLSEEYQNLQRLMNEKKTSP